jgi:hypothetical protein
MLLLDASGKPAPLKAAAAAGQPPIRAAAVAPATPKFSVDPIMSPASAAAETAAPARSFADSELPPLKSPPPDQFAPLPSPPEPLAPLAQPSPGATLFTAPQPEENKKFELPKIESKLLIHGLIGGLGVVLLVVALIAIYVKVHTTDDEGATPPTATQPTDASAEPAAESMPPDQSSSTPAPLAPVVPAKSSVRAASKRPKQVVAPVAALGQVVVDSSPQGASIQVDGRFDSSWVTPYTIIGLDAGSHSFTVTKSGYSAETRALSVVSGRNLLSVQLVSLVAKVSVTSDPSGASVFVDGRDSGRVTPVLINLEKGAHNVLVRKAGYLDETITSEVQLGQTIGFAPRLRQLGSTDEIRSVNKMRKLFGGKDAQSGMGSVAIHTTPKGAQISVNQRVLDHRSPAEFLLNPGNYVIDISASGYKPLRRVLVVEKNGKLAIDETLDRQ